MPIEIKNLRTEKMSAKPWDVRVDRKSVLGNPFVMKNECQRDEVCEKYKVHFDKMVATNAAFQKVLSLLVETYKEYNQLNLFCWCTPKRCHAETIREYVLNATAGDKNEYVFCTNCKYFGVVENGDDISPHCSCPEVDDCHFWDTEDGRRQSERKHYEKREGVNG